MSEQLNNFPGKKLEEEKEPTDMKIFRKELSILISARNKGDIQGTMFDLTLINDINSLTEEDARMWYRVNDYESNPILATELELYQKNVANSKNTSRENFLAFIVQKITSIRLKKDTKEYDNKKHKPRT